MTRQIVIGVFTLSLAVFIISAGCDKERVVNSKEYIHDTKYIELPPDTIFSVDTIYNGDTLIIRDIDTVIQHQVVHDTVRITNVIHDTIRTVQNHYDTVTVVVHDTVTRYQCSPNALTAIAAMQAQTDPQVYEFIAGELGLSGGWVFYLSNTQMEIVQQSSTVWDIYSYVDYWAEDWSGYYPLEVYWRMTFKSGDPAVASNWQMSDPPTGVSGHRPGVRPTARTEPIRSLN